MLEWEEFAWRYRISTFVPASEFGGENLPGNLGMTAEHEFLRQKSATAEIALPDKLAKIKKADEFPTVKYKWNSNEVCHGCFVNRPRIVELYGIFNSAVWIYSSFSMISFFGF